MTLSKASKLYGVPRKTIRRHAKKEVGTPGEVHLGRHRIILSDDVEKELFDHITSMEKALYGLGTKDVRRLAYEIAERTGISHPFSREKKMAGKEWLRDFLARYPSLSIREPQGTSLARVSGFTRSKVNEFFTIYKDLLATTHATPSPSTPSCNLHGTWTRPELALFINRLKFLLQKARGKSAK